MEELNCRRKHHSNSARGKGTEVESVSVDVPMRPPNRLKVRGIRTDGFTSIKTPRAV